MRAVRPDAGHHHVYRAATARGDRPLEGDPARPPAITRAIAAGHPLPVAVIDTYALARFFSARARCGTGPGTIGALPGAVWWPGTIGAPMERPIADAEVADTAGDVACPLRRGLPLGSPDRRRSSVDERFDAPDSPLLVEGAALEKVATGAVWAEGPVWVPRRRAVRSEERRVGKERRGRGARAEER